MKQILDDGRVLFFGQQLADIEALLGSVAIDNPLRVARKGIDKLLRIDGLSLDFDTGRLKGINFKHPYRFINPLTPYPETWKNFDAISGKNLRGGMSCDAFITYLQEWDKRAASLGIKKIQLNDLSERQYSISNSIDRFSDSINVSMGPSRRAGGGGIWCDGWYISFTGAGLLESISAFRDEFNTVARRIDPRRN